MRKNTFFNDKTARVFPDSTPLCTDSTFANRYKNLIKHCTASLLICLALLLCGCQTLTDARDGWRNVTGTATEPPSAFTPTTTEEPAPKPAATPSVIMQEVIANNRTGIDHTNIPPFNMPLSDADAAALAQKLHETFLQSVPADRIDCKYAVIASEDDYRQIDPELPKYVYFEVPLNLYTYKLDNYTSNADLAREIGEDELLRLAKIANYYTMTAYGIDEEYDTDDYSDGSQLVSYFSADYCKALTDMRAEAHRKCKFVQRVLTTSDYSLVYRDGAGNYRVRICIEIKAVYADDAAKKLYGLTDADIGKWYYAMNDAVIEMNQDGKVKHIELLPVMDLFELTDSDRIAYLDSVA